LGAVASRGPGRPGKDAGPTVEDGAILDAALEAFAERGFDGTSLRELARDLGVSHNLIPQRFGTKDRVWRAAVDRGFGALLADLLKVAEDPPGDDLEGLRATIVRFVEANASRPALLRIINQEATVAGPRLDYLFDSYIDPVRELGAGLLADLRAKGRIRTDSVSLVYFLMTHGAGGPMALPALAERFGQTIDPGDAEAIHRAAVEAVDVLFDGLVVVP
jgi:AcrR family transcriptional regulator